MRNLKETSVFKLVLESYKVLKETFVPNLHFELIYKTITLALFIPIISIIFNKIVSLAGIENITNYALIRFVFSKYGFLSFIILVPMAIILIYIEFSVLIIIAYYGSNHEKIRVRDAFLKSITNMPSLTIYGILTMGMYLLILFPIFSSGFGSSLLPSLEIPNFISAELFKTLGGAALYIAILCFVVYLNIKWIFALPILVLEEKKNFLEAIKKSSKIAKNNYFYILGTFLVGFIFFIVVIVASVVLISIIGVIAVKLLPNSSEFWAQFENLFSVVIAFFIYLATFIMAPIYITIVVKIYLKRESDSVTIYLDNINTKTLKSEENIKFIKKNKLSLINFFVIVICLIYLVGKVAILSPSFGDMTTIAHRGDTNFGVENTLDSIYGAIKSKADYAEIDLLETKDNKIVVLHDSNLKRLAGLNKNVWELTLEELKELTLSQNGFEGKISTLDEVLKYSYDKINLLIEIKLAGKESTNFIDNVIETIKKNNFTEKCLIQSLDYDVIQEVKEKAKDIKVGYVIFAKVTDITSLKADFLVMEESIVNEKTVALCRILNKPLYVWTVNKESAMRNFYIMGVDGLITDYPSQVINVVEELKNNEDNF